ncbi:MotB family protein [Chromatocurvus halotolerans]|uniref:Chemotaxis protein MotB n=1 Tax=Chromatocurvus halotolerans TaxID=1132028 RepID=A0A4R2KRK2_9GAMM|nr:MotB family protein [Chromatocurvus halotolerans]TCO75392.1 chemotaxis protein MotB [Chromatocurvus halotolerans]
MIDFDQGEGDNRGAPAWMATFADLMSLLLAFFVLLLSFSEMDLERYKTIAGSMKMAFGVQQQIKADDTPKGTSVIAMEFSPGRTIPTPIQQIQQVTRDSSRSSLQTGTQEQAQAKMDDEQARALLEQKVATLEQETAADAQRLRALFADEIANENIDIESEGRFITIRIRENGSFPSGSASLTDGFLPVISKLRSAMAEIPGKVAIEGHTDNVPISGGPFPTNWALSAGRALSLTHELLREPNLEDRRMMVVGYADTQPLAGNDTAEGRARNRRVEIVIRQALAESEEYL